MKICIKIFKACLALAPVFSKSHWNSSGSLAAPSCQEFNSLMPVLAGHNRCRADRQAGFTPIRPAAQVNACVRMAQTGCISGREAGLNGSAIA